MIQAGCTGPARAAGPTWGEVEALWFLLGSPDFNVFRLLQRLDQGSRGLAGTRVCGSLAAALPLSTKQKKQKIKKREAGGPFPVLSGYLSSQLRGPCKRQLRRPSRRKGWNSH